MDMGGRSPEPLNHAAGAALPGPGAGRSHLPGLASCSGVWGEVRSTALIQSRLGPPWVTRVLPDARSDGRTQGWGGTEAAEPGREAPSVGVWRVTG